MNCLTLYLLLVKATLTTFTGGSSLPVIRHDLVVERKLITDTQLSTAVAIGRTGPGPNGMYLVSIGYYISGTPGAAAGYLAMFTPSLLAILLLRVLEGRTERPRWKGAIRGLTASAAGLMLASGLPIAQTAIHSWLSALIAIAALAAFASKRVETIWVFAAAGFTAVSATLAGFAMV
jgi:chromate transporter